MLPSLFIPSEIAQGTPTELARGTGKCWTIECEGDLHNALALIRPGETVQLGFQRPPVEVLQALAQRKPLSEEEQQAVWRNKETMLHVLPGYVSVQTR